MEVMNAIRVYRHLESYTLHLPELQPMIGKDVEIIILLRDPLDEKEKSLEAFFEATKNCPVDPEALTDLREESRI